MAQFTVATSTGATAPAAATAAATTTTTNTQEDMGLMDNVYTRLLQASDTATAELTDAQLRAAADTIKHGE